MGLFSRIGTDELADTFEVIGQALTEPSFQNEVILMMTMLAIATAWRTLSPNRLDILTGEHVLNMSWLNDARLYQEVLLAYLNAAVLEPVLSIAGLQETAGEELIINIFMLIGICWWIWLITDAFDFDDVMQHFKFHVDIAQEVKESEDPSKYSWLRLTNTDHESERRGLVGNLGKDIALWYMLSCIGAAWMPGIITHRDVTHAYVVVVLWIILHHSCYKATCWSSGYVYTLLFPSTALMPLEYCLPLMDVADSVEDLEFLVKYREYLQKRTGAELIIES